MDAAKASEPVQAAKASEPLRINGDHLVACQEDRYEELLQAKVDKYYGLMAPMLGE